MDPTQEKKSTKIFELSLGGSTGATLPPLNDKTGKHETAIRDNALQGNRTNTSRRLPSHHRLQQIGFPPPAPVDRLLLHPAGHLIARTTAPSPLNPGTPSQSPLDPHVARTPSPSPVNPQVARTYVVSISARSPGRQVPSIPRSPGSSPPLSSLTLASSRAGAGSDPASTHSCTPVELLLWAPAADWLSCLYPEHAISELTGLPNNTTCREIVKDE